MSRKDTLTETVPMIVNWNHINRNTNVIRVYRKPIDEEGHLKGNQDCMSEQAPLVQRRNLNLHRKCKSRTHKSCMVTVLDSFAIYLCNFFQNFVVTCQPKSLLLCLFIHSDFPLITTTCSPFGRNHVLLKMNVIML